MVRAGCQRRETGRAAGDAAKRIAADQTRSHGRTAERRVGVAVEPARRIGGISDGQRGGVDRQRAGIAGRLNEAEIIVGAVACKARASDQVTADMVRAGCQGREAGRAAGDAAQRIAAKQSRSHRRTA